MFTTDDFKFNFIHNLFIVVVVFNVNVCSEVAIYNKWDREVIEVKLSQYYNQMFPLYCKGSSDALLRWEVPWEANKTGLVGLTDGGETLVISVEESRRPGASSGLSLDSSGGGGGDSVMGKLKGQYICRNTLIPSDYADVFLTAPYTIGLEAEPTQYVTKGHPANLSCTASFQDPRNLKNALAFKRNTPVAPSISPDSNKYEVYPPSSGRWNGEWRLGLMAVDQKDSGRYYCVATYDEFEATAQAGFDVVVDEKPRFVRALPKIVEVMRGESVIVNCFASGLPSPTYYWERTHVYGKLQQTDRVQVLDNGTLIIADVRVKDADQYECHAENRAGSIMQTTLLKVIFKATLIPIENRVVSETEQFSVQCTVIEAEPPVTKFTWTLNTVPIYTGEEMQNSTEQRLDKQYKESVYGVQTSMGPHPKRYSSTLWFSKLDRVTSAGVYACHAHNKVGTTTEEFRVDVQYRPYAVNGKVEETEKAFVGSDVRISCEVDAKPSVGQSDFSWTFRGEKLINNRNETDIRGQITTSTLFIPQISEKFFHSSSSSSSSHRGVPQGGFFQCTVSNKVGQLTKVFHMKKLNKPGEVFFRGPFHDITPTSARVHIQMPSIEDEKEEVTEYLFRIEEAHQQSSILSPSSYNNNNNRYNGDDSSMGDNIELRPLVPVQYNDITRIAEFVITDLRFSSEYIVSMAAVNAGGRGPFVQAPRSLMTADDRVPYQPLVEALYTGATNHTFKYRVINNGGHPILRYRLTYLCKNEETGANMQNVLLIDGRREEGRMSSGGIYSVSDLLPNTTCHLKLLAENEKGMGPEFIWHTITDRGPNQLMASLSMDLLVIALSVTIFLLLVLCLLMDFCMYISSPNRQGGCVSRVLCGLCCGGPSSSNRHHGHGGPHGNKNKQHLMPGYLRDYPLGPLGPLEHDPREINL